MAQPLPSIWQVIIGAVCGWMLAGLWVADELFRNTFGRIPVVGGTIAGAFSDAIHAARALLEPTFDGAIPPLANAIRRWLDHHNAILDLLVGGLWGLAEKVRWIAQVQVPGVRRDLTRLAWRLYETDKQLAWRLFELGRVYTDAARRAAIAYTNRERDIILGVIAVTARDLTALAWRLYETGRLYAWQLFTAAEHDIASLRAWAAAQLAQLRKDAQAMADRARRDAIAAVDKEAADGYRPPPSRRDGLVRRITGVLATHDPLIRGLVNDAVRLVVGLAEIDNPAARLVATLAVKTVLDHVGVDDPLNWLLNQLLEVVTGGHSVHDVRTLAGQLSAEAGQALGFADEFWADGGQQLLGEGRLLALLGGLPFDLALAGLLAEIATDPVTAAADTAAVLGPLTRDTAAAVSALIRAA